MADAVLDASALLALLLDEPGSAGVAGYLPGARVSAVNLAETASKLADGGVPAAEVRRVLDGLGLELVPFDAAQARAVGALRPATRAAGLSLGDRACLALAARDGLPAITTDAAWRRVAAGVKVVVVGRGRA